MKKNPQFWIIICFALLSAIPFVPVAISFTKLRSSVLFDQVITWEEGREAKFIIPALAKGAYELRLESNDSDWQPVVKLSWGLKEVETSREIVPVSTPEEISLTRPIGKIHISEGTKGENELFIIFGNTNPAKHSLRIKLAKDRAVLLAEASREFGVTLAISLVLMLLLWKPLSRLSSRPDSRAKDDQ